MGEGLSAFVKLKQRKEGERKARASQLGRQPLGAHKCEGQGEARGGARQRGVVRVHSAWVCQRGGARGMRE